MHRLGVGELLRRSLATTNPIESWLSTVERVARNVKRWHGGDQPLLDSHRTAGGREKIPAGERLPRTGKPESQAQPVVDSAVPGRVTCSKSRAATFNTGDNFANTETTSS